MLWNLKIDKNSRFIRDKNTQTYTAKREMLSSWSHGIACGNHKEINSTQRHALLLRPHDFVCVRVRTRVCVIVCEIRESYSEKEVETIKQNREISSKHDRALESASSQRERKRDREIGSNRVRLSRQRSQRTLELAETLRLLPTRGRRPPPCPRPCQSSTGSGCHAAAAQSAWCPCTSPR